MADNQEVSIWNREPVLLSWKIYTWEHGVLRPESFGKADRLRDSRRLLPVKLTAPIYAGLAEWEAQIIRFTEPLPPLPARLLREQTIYDRGLVQASEFSPKLFSLKFGELIPNWDAEVRAALGTNAPQIAQQARNVTMLGLIPREEFSISYGYELQITRWNGSDPAINLPTHRALLMGYRESWWQPSIMRDLTDIASS